MKPILIVDDEPGITRLIARTLTGAGYPCRAVNSGVEAADLLEGGAFELVLLDIMMPEVDGYALLRYLLPTGTPCIFLTAKGSLADRVRGLHLGADDYIVKPFEPAELVARVESVLRRTGRGALTLTAWDVTVDTAACLVKKAGVPVPLTPKEYELLLIFLRNRGSALYRDYLYETVWGEDDISDGTRTLDTHIQRLRRKLCWGKKLRTVHRLGYCLEGESPDTI